MQSEIFSRDSDLLQGVPMDKKVLKGAAVIGIAGVIVKLLGACFRIPLTNWIGADGMSYYGFAYAIYGALIILATAGVPVAISRMVSENIALKRYKNAHKVFRVSMIIMVALGAVLFLISFFGAGFLMKIFGNPDAALAVRAISPALFFVPIVSTFRGYFQGRQNMNPTAISEITEQIIRIAVGLALAAHFISTGYIEAAAGATFGATCGAMAALCVIFIIYVLNHRVIEYKIEKNDPTIEPFGRIASKMLTIAIPIIIGSMVSPIMNILDTAIIMRRLQATGFSYEQSKHLFGLISSYCSTLIGFPQIFTQAVAISLVPAVSRSMALNNISEVRENTKLGYRLTMLLAFPCAFGLFFLAQPILLLLYGSRPDEVAEAVPTLMIMAVGIIGLALSQTSTGVLQAIGKQNIPLRNLAVAMVVKVALTFVLVGINSLNIKGAALSTLVAYMISFVLNDVSIKRLTGTAVDVLQTYVKPCAASVAMALAALAVYKTMRLAAGNTVSALVAVIVGVIVYAVLVVAVKIVTPGELEQIPGGGRLNRVISKFVRWEQND